MRRFAIILLIATFIFTVSCTTENFDSSKTNSDTTNSTYIQNKGSDTLVNLALAWAEEYQRIHPDVEISVTGGGSGTGFTALINGTIDIANASRQIKPEEIEQAQANGFEPVEFVVANDAIAVIVNRNNPIEELTLDQVAQIYKGEVNNWNELGGEDRPIVRLSRETNSGTHIYFLEEVIRLGSKEDKSIFSADTLLLPSSEGIISEVRDNPNAIGYDGLGYVTADVKTVALAKQTGGDYILPTVKTVLDLTYPISRSLFIYTRGNPTGAIQDYLTWILSSEGQAFTTKLGFVPVGGTE